MDATLIIPLVLVLVGVIFCLTIYWIIIMKKERKQKVKGNDLANEIEMWLRNRGKELN